MSRWFRFYDGALDDPKVQSLPPPLFKFWVNLLCVASRYAGDLKFEDLPFLMRESEAQCDVSICELISRGLVDDTEDGMTPHNWGKRQFQSDNSTERVKRFRNKPETVTETAPATPPETEQNTETEEKKIRRKAPRRISYPPRFEEFWKGYPTDPLMSKSEALTEWQNLTQEDQEAAIAALSAFKAATAKLGPDHRVIHACRYLKKRRFDGFRAQAEAQATLMARADGKVFIKWGTDAGDAWAAFYREQGKVPPNGGGDGWWFDSEWPPNVCRETSDPLPTPQQTEKAA